MKNISERVAEYKARIEIDLALITDTRTWVLSRYPEAIVVDLKGKPIYSSLPPDAQHMLADLDKQETTIRTMVAEALGLTIDQAEGQR